MILEFSCPRGAREPISPTQLLVEVTNLQHVYILRLLLVTNFVGRSTRSLNINDSHCERRDTSQQTRYIDTMLFWCWTDVEDCGPTTEQHMVRLSEIYPVLRRAFWSVHILSALATKTTALDIPAITNVDLLLTYQCWFTVGPLSTTVAQQ